MSHYLAILAMILLCVGCSFTPAPSTLFSKTRPLIENLLNQGRWKEANELLEINLQLIKNLSEKERIQLHLLLAKNFRYLEEYGKAKEVFQKVIELSKASDVQDYLGEAHYGLGDLAYLNWSYFKQEDALTVSTNYLDSAFTQATETSNDKLMSKILYRQGTIFQINGDEEKSKVCFKKGLDISFSIRDTVGIIRNHTHTAVALRRAGLMDSALYHHEQAYEYAKAKNRNYSEAHALGNLGSYYLQTGDIDQAQEYYEKANFLAEELGHCLVLCKSLHGMSQVREKQNLKSDARNFANLGLNIAREKGYLNFENAFNGLIDRLGE